MPHMEFDLGTRSKRGKRGTGAGDASRPETQKSRYPSGSNPNFAVRFLVPMKVECFIMHSVRFSEVLGPQVPHNPLFAGSLNVAVVDNRLGGLSKPVVGTASIPLATKAS